MSTIESKHHRKSRSSSSEGDPLHDIQNDSRRRPLMTNNYNGKEAVIRSSYGHVRQSFRRKVKEPKAKYHRLDGVGCGGASSNVDTTLSKKSATMPRERSSSSSSSKNNGTMSVGDIFSTMKRGMATFSLPFSANKNHKKSQSKPVTNRRDVTILSASSTDLRTVSSQHSDSPMSIRTDDGSKSVVSEQSNNNNNNNNNNKTPGITGIRNHGNTCYMNAIVQCLSHTDLFAEYFVMGQYKVDMTRRRNKTNAKKYGTKGELTEQLAILFKSLWSSKYSPEISNQFRNVVGKHATHYQGSNQHDAQEFLLWLLDKVHEDLNTATKKKYKKIGSNLGRSDEVVAEEALQNHMRCNSSFVHGLFQAQYRSSLTCPHCRRQSITFDPFLCISTPIPQRHTRPILVTVVYFNQQPKQVKLGLAVNTQASIQELREMLATDTGILSKQIILTELHQDNFGRTFKDSEHVNVIQEMDSVYAIEVPPLPNPNDQHEGEHILLLWINKLGAGTQAKRFGCPYVAQINRLTTYLELQKAVLKAQSIILKDGVLEQKDMDSVIRFRVVDGIPGSCYLPDDVDHPLYMATVDLALGTASEEGRGPIHLKLGAEWSKEDRDQYVSILEDVVETHSSVAQLMNQQNQTVTATLSDCFNLYTQEEQLGPEDPWLCPNCKRPQQGVKKLSLWSVPDILIIHLKRFRQTKVQGTKLDTLVEFPVQGLDMSPHIVDRSHSHSNGTSVLHWSPWKRSRHHSNRMENNVYDLYAICNHHGSMQSGHYTAYCKNPTNNLWYCFDDTNVKYIDENEIVTQSAYILFYQRSTLVSASSSDSSSCGYYDHWAYRMPNFQCLLPKVSKSHDNLCDLDGRIPNGYLSSDRSFLRGTRKYSSMVSLGMHKRKLEKMAAAAAIEETNRHSDDENASSEPRKQDSLIIPESSV